MRTTCALVLGAALAGGCASTPTAVPNAEREIALAQGALAAGEIELALLRLEKARLAYRGPDPEYLTLLMAEAHLLGDDPAEALGLAAEVLEADGAHPAANEVAGKALIRLERYEDAEQRFLSAQRAYSADEPGYRRLEDYLSFARGLNAYARADPEVAQRYWQAIEDPQLRYSLDQAVRTAVSR
jgi:tetratricopeptide (TPR) repeat protein